MQFCKIIFMVTMCMAFNIQAAALGDYETPTTAQINLEQVDPNCFRLSRQALPSTVVNTLVSFMDDASVRNTMATGQKAMAAIVCFGFGLPKDQEKATLYLLAKYYFPGIKLPANYRNSKFYFDRYDPAINALCAAKAFLLNPNPQHRTCLLPRISIERLVEISQPVLQSAGVISIVVNGNGDAIAEDFDILLTTTLNDIRTSSTFRTSSTSRSTTLPPPPPPAMAPPPTIAARTTIPAGRTTLPPPPPPAMAPPPTIAARTTIPAGRTTLLPLATPARTGFDSMMLDYQRTTQQLFEERNSFCRQNLGTAATMRHIESGSPRVLQAIIDEALRSPDFIVATTSSWHKYRSGSWQPSYQNYDLDLDKEDRSVRIQQLATAARNSHLIADDLLARELNGRKAELIESLALSISPQAMPWSQVRLLHAHTLARSNFDELLAIASDGPAEYGFVSVINLFAPTSSIGQFSRYSYQELQVIARTRRIHFPV